MSLRSGGARPTSTYAADLHRCIETFHSILYIHVWYVVLTALDVRIANGSGRGSYNYLVNSFYRPAVFAATMFWLLRDKALLAAHDRYLILRDNALFFGLVCGFNLTVGIIFYSTVSGITLTDLVVSGNYARVLTVLLTSTSSL